MCLAPEDSPQNSSAPRISAREWLAPLCRCWWFVVGIPPSGNSLRWWPSQNAEKTPQKQNPSPEAWGWIPARGIGQPIDRLYLLSINFYSLSMCWILRNKICVIKKSLAVPVSLSSLFLIWGQLGGTDSGAKFVRYFFGKKKKNHLKLQWEFSEPPSGERSHFQKWLHFQSWLTSQYLNKQGKKRSASR